MPPTIDEINQLDQAAFVARLGEAFEGEPWMVADAWKSRPFADRAGLHQALMAAVLAAPLERRLVLIATHPDLVGRAALAGTLTRASTGEQAAAGLDPGRLSAAEIAQFDAVNAAYRAKFGFPFVICAREQTKASILAALDHRLNHDRDTEIATALTEIGHICRLRLEHLVADP